jgi:hypothetical protein
MVKINPGSNVHEDNGTSTQKPGMQNVDIPEPKMVSGKFQCPICDSAFRSREDYDSHVMSKHQTQTEMPSEEPVVKPVTCHNSRLFELKEKNVDFMGRKHSLFLLRCRLSMFRPIGWLCCLNCMLR